MRKTAKTLTIDIGDCESLEEVIGETKKWLEYAASIKLKIAARVSFIYKGSRYTVEKDNKL